MFKAYGEAESSAWLTATQSFKGTQMDDATFANSMRERMGLPIPEAMVVKVCTLCGKGTDIFGAHAHCCKKLAGHRATRARLQQQQLRNALRPTQFNVHPSEPVVAVYFDRLPGGNMAKEKKTRFDVGVTLEEHKPIEMIDLTFVATVTKATFAKALTKPVGDTANDAEKGKEQYYARSYKQAPLAPLAVIRGFAQTTGGTLGDYAKHILHQVAKATPTWGLPGQCPVGARYRSLIENFSVLNQRYCAAIQWQFLVRGLHPGAYQAEDDESSAEEDED